MAKEVCMGNFGECVRLLEKVVIPPLDGSEVSPHCVHNGWLLCCRSILACSNYRALKVE